MSTTSSANVVSIYLRFLRACEWHKRKFMKIKFIKHCDDANDKFYLYPRKRKKKTKQTNNQIFAYYLIAFY